MWNTFYLKFPDQERAYWELEGLSAEIDHVGAVEGIEGWHVNIRIRDADLPQELAQFQVFPENPVRVWA